MLRWPAFLIVLSCLCNTGSYAIEFATFAIYFKQVHNWNDVAETDSQKHCERYIVVLFWGVPSNREARKLILLNDQ